MDSTSPNRGGKNGINKLCLVVFSYFHVVYKKEKKKRVAHNETAAAYADPIRTITILIWWLTGSLSLEREKERACAYV